METLRDLLRGPYVHLTDALEMIYSKHKEEGRIENPYNRSNIDWIYTSVIQTILEIEISDSFNEIKISLVPEDEFNAKEYFDISICPEKGAPQTLEFVKWYEIVDSSVVTDGCTLSNGEKIFHILWEITLYGFDEEYIAECKLSHESLLKKLLKEKYGK